MFRTLIYPLSGACDFSIELPHWSCCFWFVVCWRFGVVGLEWYPCCRLKHDINISIIRSLRLFCRITTLVVLFFVRCVSEIWCGWVGVVSVLQAEACNTTLAQVHESATYRCDDTRGCVMQFWPPDDEHMCSKHVEAWSKLIVRQKLCASSWLITEINVLRCTVSKT